MREDWLFCKVHADDGTNTSKRPVGAEWQHTPFRWDLVQPPFWTGNIGLLLGDVSNNTLSLDFDGKGFGHIFFQLVEEELATAIEGSQGWILLNKLKRTTRFTTSPERMQLLIRVEKEGISKSTIYYSKGEYKALGWMLEILANGQQTVIPPSTCSKVTKKGEVIYQHFQRQWTIGPDELQTFTEEEFNVFKTWLKAAIEEDDTYATAERRSDPVFAPIDAELNDIIAVIEESGAFDEGKRHDFVLHLCALLQKKGIKKEGAEEIVSRLVEVNGGDLEDLLLVIEYSYKIRYYPENFITQLRKEMK